MKSGTLPIQLSLEKFESSPPLIGKNLLQQERPDSAMQPADKVMVTEESVVKTTTIKKNEKMNMIRGKSENVEKIIPRRNTVVVPNLSSHDFT